MGQLCVAGVQAAPDLHLCGTSGRGDDLAAALAASQPDVAVEFTTGDVAGQHIAAMLAAGAHVVSRTTGMARDAVLERGEQAARCGRGLLLAPNFALGVLLLQRFARQAAAYFGDVEIVELHHDGKRDAPSGTALATARQIGAARRAPRRAAAEVELLPGCRGGAEAGVPIHSVRLPGLLAHQEVLFGGPGQLLTLRHDTLDRAAFLPGILMGIRRIVERTGLVDSLDPFLDP
jgi:4-hydroxy-tetrahydrodipicolinate reductase